MLESGDPVMLGELGELSERQMVVDRIGDEFDDRPFIERFS